MIKKQRVIYWKKYCLIRIIILKRNTIWTDMEKCIKCIREIKNVILPYTNKHMETVSSHQTKMFNV